MLGFLSDFVEKVGTFITLILLLLLLTREGRRTAVNEIFKWFTKLFANIGKRLFRIYKWATGKVTESEDYQRHIERIRAEGIQPILNKWWAKNENLVLGGVLCVGIGIIHIPFLEHIWNSFQSFYARDMDSTSIIILGLITLILLGVLPFLLDYWKRVDSKRHGSSKLGYWHKMLNKKDGLLINGYNAQISAKASFNHAMILAPSGAGKTTAYILPNILKLANIGHTMLISDIKGELIELTSGYLRHKGYSVQIIDLENISQSLRFNPLRRLDSEQAIKGFTEMVFDISNDGASTEGIWRQGAISIMGCIIKCLKNTEGERYANIANLNYILSSFNFTDGCKALEPFMSETAPDMETVMEFEQFRQQDIKLASGQLASAVKALSIFQTKEMRHLTAVDDFNFASLRHRKTALFFKLPVGKSSIYAPFLTIFYSQFFDYLMSTKVEEHDQSIFCLLDEFGNLKKIPAFTEIITTIRSKRVSLSLVLQDVQQLNIYGKDKAEVIKGNCASVIALSGIKGKQTLDMLKDQTGISTHTEYDVSTGKTTTTRRELFTYDELRRLSEKELLYLYKNIQPLKLPIVPIYRNPQLMKEGGLRSVNGELTSLFQPIKPLSRGDIGVVYYPIEGNLLSPLPIEENIQPPISPIRQAEEEILTTNTIQ